MFPADPFLAVVAEDYGAVAQTAAWVVQGSGSFGMSHLPGEYNDYT